MTKWLALALAALAPYLYLYVTKYPTFYTPTPHAIIPLGDDYPQHVYNTLVACRTPEAVLQHQYPGIIHLAAAILSNCNMWQAANFFTALSIALIPLGIAAWGAYLSKFGKDGWIAAALIVPAMPRLLQSVSDGQLPEKFVLLAVMPVAAMLRSRPLLAGLAAGAAIWISFLGATYTAVATFFTASPAAILAYTAAAAPRALPALHTAGEALGSQYYMYLDPLHASFYAYFNPATLFILIALGAALAMKRPKTTFLYYTALALWAAAFLLPQLNERLVRAASFLLAISTAAMALELRNRKALAAAIAVTISGPAAAGWVWAASHYADLPYGDALKTHGLFAPAIRTASCKFEQYEKIAAVLPPNATMTVAWQLDLWLLPYLYYYRPDVKVTVVMCPQDLKPPYVVSGVHPGSWYLPCYRELPPGICDVKLYEDTRSN